MKRKEPTFHREPMKIPRRVIVINGFPESGKGEFVKHCSKHYNVKYISSVDKVKEAAMLLGWDGIKTSSSRKLLAILKQLSIKCFEGPIKYVRDEISELGYETILFIDCREPKEITKIEQEFDATTVLVSRSIARNNMKFFSNSADENVESFNYDFYIDNDGTTEDLAFKAMKFMEMMLKGTKDARTFQRAPERRYSAE